MTEVELKFQIPETRRMALMKAIDPKKSEIIQLQAKYYDTPDHLLSAHGVALRQRLEGTRWIQTLKAAGKSHLHRFEDNYDLGEFKTEITSDHTEALNQILTPSLDLSIYDQNPEAKRILDNALGHQKESLQLQFETDIQRTLRVISYEDAEIEVCVDIGQVKSGEKSQEIHEVEFELKSGKDSTLLAFSFEWVKKYQLWLDVRSKAEYGNLLLQDLLVSPAALEKEIVLAKKESA